MSGFVVTLSASYIVSQVGGENCLFISELLSHSTEAEFKIAFFICHILNCTNSVSSTMQL